MFYDFHADLLSQVALLPDSSFYDEGNKNSIPQLVRGNVTTQIFPIFVDGHKHEVDLGIKQAELYLELQRLAPLKTLWAIENASAFFKAREPFAEGLARLSFWIKKMGKPIYIGMTWNLENRFGGGNETLIGLHEDGKRLLAWMNAEGIALDFSHACDPMAYQLLQEIDQQHYTLPVLASHSNFRAICPHARNLPDAIAQEIIKRKGVIGLNLFAPFLGVSIQDLVRHIEHAVTLGAIDTLVLGSDFFSQRLGGALLRHYDQTFFPGFGDSTCFSALMDYLQSQGLIESLLAKIAHSNAQAFLARFTK